MWKSGQLTGSGSAHYNTNQKNYSQSNSTLLMQLAPVRADSSINGTVAIQMARKPTFYGLYFSSAPSSSSSSSAATPLQGPHTIAYAAIHETLENLDMDALELYFLNLETPKGIEDILKTKEDIYESEAYGYEKTTGKNPKLDVYLEEYKYLYNNGKKIITTIKRTKEPDKKSIYIYELVDIIERLINYSPYATYAWNLSDGATPSMIYGKRETAINCAALTTAADVIRYRIFDDGFQGAGTYSNIAALKKYMKSIFISLPDAEIDKLIPSLSPPK